MHDLKSMSALSARRPIFGLAVIGLGASLPPLDLAVNVAFPAITAAFELQTQSIRWVVAAYVVMYASLMLAFGRLGDIVGYRRIFRAGLVLGAVAFVLCGLAPNYDWLLAARMLQGIAAALLLSCAPALATSLFDEGRRLWVLGAFASMAATAGLLAPLLGGVSIAAFGWSGVFWFRVPIALLALLFLRLLPDLPPAHPTEPRKFDLAGSVLLAAGIASLLLAVTLVQSADNSWQVPLVAVAGVTLLAGFARRQRSVEHPFLPSAIVRDPAFALRNLASISVHLAGFTVPLLVPYFLARILAYGPTQSGAVLTSWPLGMLIGSALATPTVRRLGSGPTALIGGALVATGLFTIGHWPAGATPLLMLPGLMLHGAGIGLFQVAYTDIIIATLPRSDRGVAGSLTILTRTIGIVLGATCLSALFHYTKARYLADGLAPPDAFLAGFQSVYLYVAIAFTMLFALVSMRRGLWTAG